MATKDQQVNYPINDNQNGFNTNQSKPVFHHNHPNKLQNNAYNSYNKNLNYYSSNAPPNQQKSSKRKFNTNYANTNHFVGYQNHNGNYHSKFNQNFNNMNSKTQNKSTFKSLSYNHRYQSNQNANNVDLKYDSACNSTSASNSVTPPASNSTNTTVSPSSNLASPKANSLSNVNVSTSNNEIIDHLNQSGSHLNKKNVANSNKQSEVVHGDQSELNDKKIDQPLETVEQSNELTVSSNLVSDLSNLQINNDNDSKTQQQTGSDRNQPSNHIPSNGISFKSNAANGQQNTNHNGTKSTYSPKDQLIINPSMTANSNHYYKQHPLQNGSNYSYNNNKNQSNKVHYNNYSVSNYNNQSGYQFPTKMNSYSRGKGKSQHGNAGSSLHIMNSKNLNQINLPNNIIKNATNHPHSSNVKLMNYHMPNGSLLQNHPHPMMGSSQQLIQQFPNSIFYPGAATYPPAVFQQPPPTREHNVNQQSSSQTHHPQANALTSLHPSNCFPNCCTQSGIYFTANSPGSHQYLIPQPPPNAYPSVTSAPLTQSFFSFTPYHHFNTLNGNLPAGPDNGGNLPNYREYKDLNGTGQQQANGHNPSNTNLANHTSSNGSLNNKYNPQQVPLDHVTTHYVPAQFTYNPYMQILPNYYTTANSYLQQPTNNESQPQLGMVANTSNANILNQQLASTMNNHSVQQNSVVNQQQSGQSQDQYAITNTTNVDTIPNINDHSRTNSNSYDTSGQVNGLLQAQSANKIPVFNEQLSTNGKYYTNYNSNAIDYNQIVWQNSNMVSNNMSGNTDDLSSHNLNVNYLQTVNKTISVNYKETASQSADNLVDKK